ncbi:MAG: hypothetical protein V6Z89_18955 [Desulfobacter sp.]
MTLKITLLSLVMTLVAVSSAFACTSFALYGSQVVYGMNFDYFAVPLKFLIESCRGMNVFHLSFLFDRTVDDPEYKGYFARTCGMNAKGLFCASQEIEPYIEGRKQTGADQMHIDDHYDTLNTEATVKQVREQIRGRQWIQHLGPSIHHLFADAGGNAMVTETDNTANFITGIRENFIVMSNFANHSLAGKPYTAAAGAGADRYVAAYEYILKHMDAFGVDNGFELLESASMTGPDFETLCSMVFQPRTGEIYIALHRDFGTVWKVCLDRKTIEPYRGYTKFFRRRLGDAGLPDTDLQALSV